MEELIQLIAKTYGLAGLIMLSPFVAVVFLWRHTVAQTKEIARVNEQRVQEAKEIVSKLLTALNELSATNKETNIALERVGDLMSVLSNQSH